MIERGVHLIHGGRAHTAVHTGKRRLWFILASNNPYANYEPTQHAPSIQTFRLAPHAHRAELA